MDFKSGIVNGTRKPQVSGPKQLAFDQFARLARALGSPHRLELLDILAQGERSVERLAEAAHLPLSNASQHLQQLRRAGLVVTRKAGTHVIYSLPGPEVIDLIRTLWRVGERNLAELERIIQQYYRNRDSLEPVARDELLGRLRRRSVIVIDVRPEEEYAAGHVQGAISIPVTELQRRLKQIPEAATLSPAAAARTVSIPIRPSRFCERRDFPPGACTEVSWNGRRTVCQSIAVPVLPTGHSAHQAHKTSQGLAIGAYRAL